MKLGMYLIMLVTMMVFLEFLSVPTGLSVTLAKMGITINPNAEQLVNADISGSTLWILILTTLSVLAAGGAVVVGLFAKSYDTSLVILPIILAVGGYFIGTSWTIIKYVQGFSQDWITMLISLIFVAIGVGFLMSCIDYFAGR